MKPCFVFEIAVSLVGALSAGCTYGLPRPHAEAVASRPVDTMSRAIVATETARMETERLQRAVIFREQGRYYR